MKNLIVQLRKQIYRAMETNTCMDMWWHCMLRECVFTFFLQFILPSVNKQNKNMCKAERVLNLLIFSSDFGRILCDGYYVMLLAKMSKRLCVTAKRYFPPFPYALFFTLSHTPTVIRSTMVAENRKRNHIIHKYTHTAHFTINENIRVYYYLHFTFFFLQKTDCRIAVCQQSYFGFN